LAAAAKQSLQHSVVNLTGNNITAAAIEEAADKQRNKVSSAEGKVTNIYSIFDTFDGTKSLPVKHGGDNRHHVPGRLEVADHNFIKSLVNLSIPL
jgi:hypothetical protein